MEQNIYINNSDSDSDSTIIDEQMSKEFNANIRETFKPTLFECSKKTWETELHEDLALPTSSFAKLNNSEIIVLSDSSNEKFETDELLKTSESFFKNRNSCEIELHKNNTIFESQDFDYLIANGSQHRKNENATNIDMEISDKNYHKEIDKDILEEKTSNKKKSRKKKQMEISTSKGKEKSDNKKRREEKDVNTGQNSQTSANYEKYLKEIILNLNELVLQNQEYGDYITDKLESSSVSYRTSSTFPFLSSWTRKIETTENADISETEREEKHYMLILTPDKFGSLMELMLEIKEHINFHHIFVIVYSASKPTNNQAQEIMEIELFYPTFWQFAPTKEDLFQYIFMATKCIAQMPYKLEKEIFFNESKRDTVKVDKKGNGLNRLWRQMLTMFPLARLETAEAITNVYPTLPSLFEAYEECTEPGETLIQDLPIRRAQGPLASARRLGGELSRICYNYFTSEDNILIK